MSATNSKANLSSEPHLGPSNQLRSQVMAIAHSYMGAQALLTANELGLFDQLATGALTIQGLSRRLGCDLRGLQALVSALCCLDLIEQRGNKLHLSPASRSVLTRHGAESIAVMLDHQQKLYQRFSGLITAVRTGQPKKKKTESRSARRRFLQAMTQGSRTSLAQTVATLDFSRVSSWLDLGGGGGAYAAAFQQAAPDADGTVFDTPETIAFTRQLLRERGLARSIRCLAGDARTDALGGPYDLIFISNLLHIFSPAEITGILRRASRSLARGGQLVIKDFFLAPNRRSPQFAGLFALNMLLSSDSGGVYTTDEFRKMLAKAHLGLRRRIFLGQASQIWITGVKRRQ